MAFFVRVVLVFYPVAFVRVPASSMGTMQNGSVLGATRSVQFTKATVREIDDKRVFTLRYMYAVHVRRTGVRRTCIIV